ncbi:synaptonemal complex protein 3-like [Psammomys obesus]|uniref:synaptonemal complex protein 3-like n=1 Tax=Psammomys obesus TaxID=48139 RepID=UPI0024536BEB|nr:synaptonemal complex protein 3-like [Psammomys obesus]
MEVADFTKVADKKMEVTDFMKAADRKMEAGKDIIFAGILVPVICELGSTVCWCLELNICFGEEEGGQMVAGSVAWWHRALSQLSSVVVENKTRMQSYIKSVVKDCNRNIKEHWKVHQDEMREFKIEYTEQIISVFKQWDSDIKQVEDQENELTSIFNQQQKTFQQARMLQTDNLKALKQADDEFLKDLEDLENYSSVLKSIHNEFKKQKTLLQRKLQMVKY